jgi:hypothetical protein
MSRRRGASVPTLDAFVAAETRAADEAARTASKQSARLGQLERRLKSEIAARELAEMRYEAILATATLRPSAPIRPRERNPKVREGVPVLMLSDLHVEAVVDPAKVNGLNEFNPTIAKQRMERVFIGADDLVRKMHSGYYKIREMVVWLGGDLVSGFIHDELIESNAMHPTTAMMLCGDFVIAGIDFLLANTVERITIPCNFGNHDRMHQKKKIATAAENSLAFMLYHQLRRHYARDKRVVFDIAPGEFLYTQIYDRTFRWTHGDAIQYAGGVGGIMVPVSRAVMRWQQAKRADYTVMGHFHQFTGFGTTIVNGSLVGYDTYAIHCGFNFEHPAQGFFVVDKRWGLRHLTPLFCGTQENAPTPR